MSLLPFARLGVVAAGALAGLACAVLPASAAPVVNLDCNAGISTYYCEANYSGNVSAVSITWTINGTYAPAFDNDILLRSDCVKNQSLVITATVTDTSGSTVGEGNVTCGNPFQ